MRIMIQKRKCHKKNPSWLNGKIKGTVTRKSLALENWKAWPNEVSGKAMKCGMSSTCRKFRRLKEGI